MNKQLVKKVALYGGAFDPPHKGHLAIINNLNSLDFINEIWLLPCGDRSDKKLLLNKDERFELLNKISNGNNKLKNVHLSNEQIELSRDKKRMIPTIELLDYLENKHPSYQFHFVVGSDILCTINGWQEYQRLLKQKHFIVYPRVGYQIKDRINEALGKNDCRVCQHIPKHCFFSEYVAPEISSSFIKNTLLEAKLSKQEKRKRVIEFLEPFTQQILQNKQYI